MKKRAPIEAAGGLQRRHGGHTVSAGRQAAMAEDEAVAAAARQCVSTSADLAVGLQAGVGQLRTGYQPLRCKRVGRAAFIGSVGGTDHRFRKLAAVLSLTGVPRSDDRPAWPAPQDY